jgi:hypothetical protein
MKTNQRPNNSLRRLKFHTRHQLTWKVMTWIWVEWMVTWTQISMGTNKITVNMESTQINKLTLTLWEAINHPNMNNMVTWTMVKTITTVE